MTACKEDPAVECGTWIKGDKSRLYVQLLERNAAGKAVPMPISDATSIVMEIRSRQGTGAEFSKTCGVEDLVTAWIFAEDPGENWTAPDGHASEDVEAFVRVNKADGPRRAKDVLHFTLRTAP